MESSGCPTIRGLPRCPPVRLAQKRHFVIPLLCYHPNPYFDHHVSLPTSKIRESCSTPHIY